MPRDVSPAFAEQFEKEVHQAYQEEGDKLAMAVRVKRDVVGKSVHFPVFGKGAARDRGASASDVPVMGVGATDVEVSMVKKIAADYSDVFDEAQLAFEDRQELAGAIGYAIRRSEDQLIIDALNTSTTSNIIPADFDDGATPSKMSLKKLKRAAKLLNRNGVPRKDRYLAYTPDGLDGLLDEVEVNSADYNTVKSLVDGDVDTFMGFKFIMISDEEITVDGGSTVTTGLPGVGTTDRKYFAFHRRSVGYGVSIDKKTEADWVAHKASYLVQSHLLAGAKEIDPTGIVIINVKEDA